jgi:protein-L-isoaspartate(D-aspartate) O-methyltransferase
MSAKENLIQELIDSGYLKSPHIIEAFLVIDRKDFVASEYQDEAYSNIPLPIGFRQTISQPLTVAFILELLQPQAGEKILDIGAGSGWTSALLGYIVSQKSKKGKVIAIERIPELKEFGEKNVAKYNFIEKGVVEFICADGSKGHKKEALYDKILCSATVEEIPQIWLKQLKIGGRIVAPLDGEVQLWIKKAENNFDIQRFQGFTFVPLITNKQ